jgi:hypothetical protein
MTPKPRGITLAEVIIALVIMTTAMMAVVTTISNALLLSETNRQYKMAIFDTQAVVDLIAGTPYEEICNASVNFANGPRFPQGMYYRDPNSNQVKVYEIDYPSAAYPWYPWNPTHAYYQFLAVNPYVKLNLMDTDPSTNEKIYIFYFSDTTRQQYFHTNILDRNLDPRRSDFTSGEHPDLNNITWTAPAKPWLPLDRPSGSPASVFDLKNNPDPLFVTVRCVWTGPRGQDMSYELSFMITNLLDTGE